MSAKVAVGLASAAEAVELSESYLRRAIKSGALRAKLVDRKYRIALTDLQAWFDTLPDA